MTNTVSYFTLTNDSSIDRFNINSANSIAVTIGMLDPKYPSFKVLRDGVTYSNWAMVDARTIKINAVSGEHTFEIDGVPGVPTVTATPTATPTVLRLLLLRL